MSDTKDHRPPTPGILTAAEAMAAFIAGEAIASIADEIDEDRDYSGISLITWLTGLSNSVVRGQANRTGVLREIAAERVRQDETWGEQNHPDIDPRDIPGPTRNEYAFRAERWKEIVAERATPTISGGRCHGHPAEPHVHSAWDAILLEEVYEALTEAAGGDVAKLRKELIQVAAVAAQWVEAIDRRQGADHG